jgi:beta-galactosidase
MQRLVFAVCSFFFAFSLPAQELKQGGLGMEGRNLVLVGSAEENRKNQGQSLENISYLNFNDQGVKTQLAPKLPNGLNWMAVFNASVKGKTKNFFLYDGWMAATERITTNHRLRRFEEDITAAVSSNAYHIAFQRKQVVENEVFMLVVSPRKQKVIIHLKPEQFGVNRQLEYEMGEWEAKFVHLVMPPPEYTVITWQPENTARRMQPLTQGWSFLFDEGDRLEKKMRRQMRPAPAVSQESMPPFTSNDRSLNWQPVTIPHTWNATDIFDSRNFKDSINIMELFKRGSGWYKKSFSLPVSEKRLHHRLLFLGANQVTEAWLNGKYLGKHIGGYTGFAFDLNDKLLFGETNELWVKVDNRFDYDIPPHTADYNFLGGLYREVYLVSTNPARIEQTRFTTPKVSHRNAAMDIKTRFQNPGRAAVKMITNLVSPYNEIIQSWVHRVETETGTIHIKDTLRNPLLWSTENPTLYELYTTLYDVNNRALDQVKEKVGFRFFDFKADSGFYLNGESLKLKGVNVHQDYLNQGWAVDSAQKREDYVWMKKMGVNYVRMSHYPKHPYELYLCDSLGFVVWEEIPVVNTVGRDLFISRAKDMMCETIERDYNRPSVIFWGVGNEYYRNFFTTEDAEYALKCTREVAAVCKQLDPYRFTIQAQNDLVDERIMGLTDIQGRNRYFGWYEKTYADFEKEMEEERHKHPDWKLLVSEYGAEGKYGHHVAEPRIFDHSETYQVNFHKAYWEVISKHPYLAGGTIWNMFDFASFAKIGNSPHINKKGMLTFDRKPKDVFYYYQSVWTNEAMVRIAGHTNTHRRTLQGQSTSLEVFSNAEVVELFVNGQSQGKKQKSTGYTWQVMLPEGYHRIKAVAVKEGITVTDETAFFLRLVKSLNTGENIRDLDGDGF